MTLKNKLALGIGLLLGSKASSENGGITRDELYALGSMLNGELGGSEYEWENTVGYSENNDPIDYSKKNDPIGYEVGYNISDDIALVSVVPFEPYEGYYSRTEDNSSECAVMSVVSYEGQGASYKEVNSHIEEICGAKVAEDVFDNNRTYYAGNEMSLVCAIDALKDHSQTRDGVSEFGGGSVLEDAVYEACKKSWREQELARQQAREEREL